MRQEGKKLVMNMKTVDPIAFLWDRSNIWGLMAYRSFRALGIHFSLVTADDVVAGGLEGFKVLFVPGGWATEKLARLGDKGAGAIAEFVRAGGAYLGVCGGAGLALNEPDGLSLVSVKRRKGLSNFSGPIMTEWEAGAAIAGAPGRILAPVWWPGHFDIEGAEDIEVFSRYLEPAAGFMVSDLFCDDIGLGPAGYPVWEKAYGMRLDPGELYKAPCVLQARVGAGKALLSYLHLETPGFPQANGALVGLLGKLAGQKIVAEQRTEAPALELSNRPLGRLGEVTASFFQFGQRNHLWSDRNSWLIKWRRGIRGIEYCALMKLGEEIARRMADGAPADYVEELEDFFQRARKLLMAEKLFMAQGMLQPYKCPDPLLQNMRVELFGEERRPGGLYSALMERTESLLLACLA